VSFGVGEGSVVCRLAREDGEGGGWRDEGRGESGEVELEFLWEMGLGRGAEGGGSSGGSGLDP
jgi:hypothetical protein